MLVPRGLNVAVVEPNDAMRNNGTKRTASLVIVRWHKGNGEQTGQATKAFSMVSFGSSLNVWDRQFALKETAQFLTRAVGLGGCRITANSMIRFSHRSNRLLSSEQPIMATVLVVKTKQLPLMPAVCLAR